MFTDNPQVTCQGEVQSGADSRSIDCRNGGDGATGNRQESLIQTREILRSTLPQYPQVSAGTKGRSSACNYEGLDTFVAFCGCEHAQLFRQPFPA